MINVEWVMGSVRFSQIAFGKKNKLYIHAIFDPWAGLFEELKYTRSRR